MGIYDSGMSCWQRRMAGLPADNAGPGVIDNNGENEEKVVKKVEKVEVKADTTIDDDVVPVKKKADKKTNKKGK